MFLGLSKDLILECENLKSGYTLFHALKEANATSLKDKYKCGCGEEHTYLDGLIAGYTTSHTMTSYGFISNFQKHGETEVKIGEAKNISIGIKLQKWHKIFVSPYSADSKGTFLLEAVHNTNWDYFYLLSSACELPTAWSNKKTTPAILGESAKVSWLVYGCTDIKDLHVWQQLLLVSREQLINEQYSLAYLTAAMTLESYISFNIKNKLLEKEISEKTADTILKETTINDKLIVFCKELLDVDFSIDDHFKLSNKRLKGLFDDRNKIAHGKNFEVTKDKAYDAFEITIKAILKVEETLNPQLFDFPQCFITE